MIGHSRHFDSLNRKSSRDLQFRFRSDQRCEFLIREGRYSGWWNWLRRPRMRTLTKVAAAGGEQCYEQGADCTRRTPHTENAFGKSFGGLEAAGGWPTQTLQGAQR